MGFKKQAEAADEIECACLSKETKIAECRLLRQPQYDEHWNTTGYNDTRWCQSDDSDSDKGIEESGVRLYP